MSSDKIGIGRGKKRDIVAQIKASNKDRVETLMPIRHEHAQSEFAFFRGKGDRRKGHMVYGRWMRKHAGGGVLEAWYARITLDDSARHPWRRGRHPELKWNNGVHNYMVYAASNIPVGDYNPNRLANIGIGHGAIEFGGGYTH